MSLSQCIWVWPFNPNPCLDYPLIWVFVIISVSLIAIVLWRIMGLFLHPLTNAVSSKIVETQQNIQGEFQLLTNIDRADSWSCDDILLRIHQIKRALNPESGGFIKISLLNPNNRNQLEDTLFRLERIATRRNCHEDNTSSDTIIGYSND